MSEPASIRPQSGLYVPSQGDVIPYGPYTITKEEIIEFAEEFDPIYFHLDEEAAKDSLLGGLSASGWHTCCATMRMLCDAFILNSTCEGSPGLEECRWLAPVRPGDILSGTATVVSARPSSSRPGKVVATFLLETFNQKNEKVLSMSNTVLFGQTLKEEQNG